MSKLFINSIGTVIPLGDGGTGKSIIMRHLIDKTKSEKDAIKLLKEIKKSLDAELEYDTKILNFEDKIVSTALQYFVFPGQRQRTSASAPTFEDVVKVYEVLPAFKSVSVILLVYDTSNLGSLHSLEYWLSNSISRNWITSKTKIILVSNKIDIKEANKAYVDVIKIGVFNIITASGIDFKKNQITSIDTSAATLEGIEDLREQIFEWVALNGINRKRVPLPQISK